MVPVANREKGAMWLYRWWRLVSLSLDGWMTIWCGGRSTVLVVVGTRSTGMLLGWWLIPAAGDQGGSFPLELRKGVSLGVEGNLRIVLRLMLKLPVVLVGSRGTGLLVSWWPAAGNGNSGILGMCRWLSSAGRRGDGSGVVSKP